MLIRKVDKRIHQYLTFLDKNKYETILKPEVKVAKTLSLNYQIPHALEKTIITFPYHYGEEKYNFWFFSSLKIPSRYKNDEIYVHAPTGTDSLVFINGEVAGAVNPYHPKIKIHDSEKSSDISIAIEAYAGHRIPGYHPMHDSRIILTLARQIESYPIIFPIFEILIKNKVVYDLYYDVLVLFDLANQLPDDSLRKNEILRELYHSLIKIHFVSDKQTLDQEAQQASETLKGLLLKNNGPTVPKIYAIGHAHIDHAWLWPLAETTRKAARTFSNMINLGKEYPEFVFIQSQPAQLELVEKYYPIIFDRVKNAFKKGQWEPNGGMFVEADTNIPNSESLIRQFLIGRSLTKKYFDYYGDTLWLPDVFGYSGNLPQILKGCGIKYFVTSKISWNDTTKFPYDTFTWSGIDGSTIKSHFLTSSYEGFVSVKAIVDGWNRVQHKEVQDSLIKPFGEGDGGGGSTRSDLEVMKRITDLEGCPRTKWSKVSTALEEIFSNTHDLPIWQGELYLEFHRGTYTTIANTKKYNRKIEQLFRNVEFFGVLCTPEVRKMMGFTGGRKYPQELLYDLWKRFLTHQFHDIIPGSSINQVNVETLESYRSIVKDLENLQSELQQFYLSETGNNQEKTTYLVLNSLSWNRLSLVQIPIIPELQKFYESECNSQKFPCQVFTNFNNDKFLYTLASLPAMSCAKLKVRNFPKNYSSPFQWARNSLTTPYYTVEFTNSMQIESVKLIGDEFNYISSDQLFNTIQIAEDMPVTWDAWDIEWDTFEHKIQNLNKPTKTEFISDGPLFFHIRIYYEFTHSKIIQDIMFYAFDERIDFKTKVDWHEEHKVLRVIFPTAIYSDSIKCEIQNGFLQRPTLKNRNHEKAMFEICAHKWIVLEDGLRGLALLNDSKYGHNVTRNQLGLTLLRSPKRPDHLADMGEHIFTYSILPFKNSPINKVIQKGYELNNSPIVFSGSLPEKFANTSLFTISNQNIVVESVKYAESQKGWIIRMYESTGSSNECSVTFNTEINSISTVNMIEEESSLIGKESNKIDLKFTPFETKTLLLQ